MHELTNHFDSFIFVVLQKSELQIVPIIYFAALQERYFVLLDGFDCEHISWAVVDHNERVLAVKITKN